MPSYDLELRYREICGQRFPTVEYADSPSPLCVAVVGEIIPWSYNNSTPEKGKKSQEWKVKIATAVESRRGGPTWDSSSCAISIGMAFDRESSKRKLDVDNHIKPILDAIAAGLFCGDLEEFVKPVVEAINAFPKTRRMPRPGKKIGEIPKWDFDDSKFKTVFVHRLPDRHLGGEGIAICISSLPSRQSRLCQV